MKHKLSFRCPAELLWWLEAEANRRQCDLSAVIVDAIRLAATAAEITQTTQVLKDLVPLLTQRLDRLEHYTVQTTNFAGAIAQKQGVFDHAQAGYEKWKSDKEGATK